MTARSFIRSSTSNSCRMDYLYDGYHYRLRLRYCPYSSNYIILLTVLCLQIYILFLIFTEFTGIPQTIHLTQYRDISLHMSNHWFLDLGPELNTQTVKSRDTEIVPGTGETKSRGNLYLISIILKDGAAHEPLSFNQL